MPRDANGNYTLPSGNPVVSGEVISTSWANPTMSDLAVEMTSSLDRNGKGGMLAPFKFLDGDAGAPGLTFTSDPSMGFFRAGVKDLQVSVNGPKMRWTGTGVDVTPDDGATWYPLMQDGDPGFPFLPLAGGSMTGGITMLGGVDIQLNNGGQITLLGPTNAGSQWMYNTDAAAVYDTSHPSLAHIFNTGTGQRLAINDANATFTTAVSVNNGLTMTLWNGAMNGFNQMYCGSGEAYYVAGGAVNYHLWYTAGARQMSINATGLSIGAIIPSNRIDILGANNDVATFNDGMTIRSLNETVWTKYGWAGINTVTGFTFAASDVQIFNYSAGGMAMRGNKPFLLNNAGNTAVRGLQLAATDEMIMLGAGGGARGAVAHHLDAANQNGAISVSASAASGTPGTSANGAIWLQYV